MVTEPMDSVHQLTADAQVALGDLVAALAESKKLLGVRYGEWVTQAPTMEASVAASAMAQDELGHARVLYGLLDEARGEKMRDDTGWEVMGTHLSLLERPFLNWMEFVACNALVDPALTVVVEAATDSR
ncbi:MAG TPA: Phenylacetic acid catabolic protein, partial [bacterium]|nr:Phenylacetic acid catabolic protein [bacterium]